MEYVYFVLCLFLGTIVYSYGLSMIFLAAFFGIPTLKEAKKEKIIKSDAPNIYISSIVIWIIILAVSSYVAFFIIHNLEVAFIISIVISIVRALKSLSKNNEPNNMNDFFQTYNGFFIDK